MRPPILRATAWMENIIRTILFKGTVNHADGNTVEFTLLTESIIGIEIRELNGL